MQVHVSAVLCGSIRTNACVCSVVWTYAYKCMCLQCCVDVCVQMHVLAVLCGRMRATACIRTRNFVRGHTYSLHKAGQPMSASTGQQAAVCNATACIVLGSRASLCELQPHSLLGNEVGAVQALVLDLLIAQEGAEAASTCDCAALAA